MDDMPHMALVSTAGTDSIITDSANSMSAYTTGRGSVYGCKPAPCIKVATNTAIYERMTDDMDINCGDILEGKVTLSEKAQQIFDLMLRIASGEKTKSELLGLGDHEYVPWNIGVTG